MKDIKFLFIIVFFTCFVYGSDEDKLMPSFSQLKKHKDIGIQIQSHDKEIKDLTKSFTEFQKTQGDNNVKFEDLNTKINKLTEHIIEIKKNQHEIAEIQVIDDDIENNQHIATGTESISNCKGLCYTHFL